MTARTADTYTQKTSAGGTICWHATGAVSHDCPGKDGNSMLWYYGRCRSGARWFWAAQRLPWHSDELLTLHGKTGTEADAIDAARSAIRSRCGSHTAVAIRREGIAPHALKEVNAQQRKTRPPQPGATQTRATEFLYEPWTHYDDMGIYSEGIAEIPIVKKTPKRIYYNRTSRTDRYRDVVTLGYISRQDFESDTRCQSRCQQHSPGAWCPEHYSLQEHCQHGSAAGTCWHGEPPGAGRMPSDSGYGMVYATREAAAAVLRKPAAPPIARREAAETLLRRLRREMADAHPDRGGTSEGFITARTRYQDALRATR